MVTFPMTLTDG